jgi:hypothetical protein
VLLDIPNGDVTEELAGDILDTTEPARKAGVEVSVGGNLGSVLSKSPTESSEVVGLLAAMVILALTFGSLVAMGMPIITAVLGLATALGLIGLLGHLFDIPTVGARAAHPDPRHDTPHRRERARRPRSRPVTPLARGIIRRS